MNEQRGKRPSGMTGFSIGLDWASCIAGWHGHDAICADDLGV